MRRFRPLILAPLALALPIALVQPAQSRIVCDGNYQIVQGQPLATPYCMDDNLARVARGYGMRISVDSMRYDESAKGQVCRAIGHDNRVREACLPYRNDGGSRFRF